MLVLQRRPEESLWIGTILVKVLAVDGDKVRIGIDAPREVPILRTELRERTAPPRPLPGPQDLPRPAA